MTRQRKLDFTKDMPLRERRKIQNKRCSKCEHGIVLMEYEGENIFTCKRYYNYWHYIRKGICKQYKNKRAHMKKRVGKSYELRLL